MVHYSKVLNGISLFVEKDLISKMNGSMKAWALGTAVALAVKRGPKVFSEVRDNPVIKALGLVDGEMIDIEAIYPELLSQAQKHTATLDIPMIGPVTYSTNDVESLYKLIMD